MRQSSIWYIWASRGPEICSGLIMGFPHRNYFCFGSLTLNVSFLWFELSSLFTLSHPVPSGHFTMHWILHRAVLQNLVGWQKRALFVLLRTVRQCNLAASQKCALLHDQSWNSLRSETVFDISFVFLLATQHMLGTWLLLNNYLLNGWINSVTSGSRVTGQMVPKRQKSCFLWSRSHGIFG